jgi:diguanylate cyclase (GGDEF)-like protein/PAS domain S-box-containing protein
MIEPADPGVRFAIHAASPASAQPLEAPPATLHRLARLALRSVNARTASFWFDETVTSRHHLTISNDHNLSDIDYDTLRQAVTGAIASGLPCTFFHRSQVFDSSEDDLTYLAVPLRCYGLFSAALVVTDEAPRQWLPDEIVGLQDIASLAESMLAATPIVEPDYSEQLAQLEASERRFRKVFAEAAVGVITTALDGRFLQVNRAFCQITGYSERELRGTNILEITHFEDVEKSADRYRQLIEDMIPYFHMETRYVRFDGRIVPAELSSSLACDDDGRPLYVIGLVQDLSERKVAEAMLRENEQRYRSLFYHNPDAVFSLDPRGTCLSANPACEEITGYKVDEILRSPLSKLVVREDLPSTLRHIVRTARGDAQSFEIGIIRKSGERARLRITTLPIIVDGEIVGIYGIAKDETDRRNLEEQLAHQAFHDALTRLPNRNLFLDRLQHALARAGRSQTLLAVLFLDLDNFKVINDSLGHDVGDQLLMSVAARLSAAMRDDDIAARLGGDEFILLLEGISDVSEAERVAQRIHDILKAPFTIGRREVFVTSSIGIAIGSSPDDRPDDLLRNADVAMYGAKRNGRACYEVFDPEMHTSAVQRLEFEQDLRQAIEHHAFRVHYQPKLDIATGEIVELEALIRWQHPERGIILPGEFIPLAEETGLIVPIGQWILREACHQLRRWQIAYPEEAPRQVSVNLSTVQLRLPTLIDDVAAVLHETGLDPNCLSLEITESAVMHDPELAMGTLSALKALGVRLAIDDFGTGYSSLSYLKRFPVDLLKIDQTFIGELGSADENSVIVGVTIRLAHALGMRVVAEGVEAPEQLNRLRELNCDLAQGYHISHPLPASAIEQFITGRA